MGDSVLDLRESVVAVCFVRVCMLVLLGDVRALKEKKIDN